MVRIRLLGGATIEQDDWPVTGRPAQRHPLALLALLAVSPGSTASRDRLIGFLWPESDTATARHRLSVALHVLRKALGREAIPPRSDGVALNPTQVETDVGSFLNALAEGRLEDAVRLYTGPFLEGFYLSGALGFERWVDEERARLAALYAGALQQLATDSEARRDAAGAVRWWRLLVSHDPYSASAALGLIGALRAAGDRAGALRHARGYAALLKGELGVPPEPGIGEAAREVAAELAVPPEADPPAPPSSPSAPVRPAPPGRGGWPDRGRFGVIAAVAALVLVAAWGVWRPGPADDDPAAGRSLVVVGLGDDLAEELAEAVAATLMQVPNLQVQVLDPAAAGRSPAGAARFARAVGADLVLDCRVHGAQERPPIEIRLLDPAGDELWTTRLEHPYRSRERFVADASLALADSLRLRLAPYIPKVYTTNQRAWDQFLQGVYAHRRMTPQDLWVALNFYREAYQEDPDFALAHAIAGNAYMSLVSTGIAAETGYELARQQVLRALALDSTLAEGHAALGAIRIWRDQDYAGGEASLRRAIMLYPTLPQARSWYGAYLLHVHEATDEGLAGYRKALDVDPLNAARSYAIERALVTARRYEDVITQRETTRRLDPDLDFSFSGAPLADAYRELGRWEDALVEYRRVEERVGGGPFAGHAVTYARLGRLAEARSILRALEERAMAGAPKTVDVAAVHAGLGNVDRAFEWLEKGLARRCPSLIGLRAEPKLDPLRQDPRYRDLLRRVGLDQGLSQ